MILKRKAGLLFQIDKTLRSMAGRNRQAVLFIKTILLVSNFVTLSIFCNVKYIQLYDKLDLTCMIP